MPLAQAPEDGRIHVCVLVWVREAVIMTLSTTSITPSGNKATEHSRQGCGGKKVGESKPLLLAVVHHGDIQADAGEESSLART